jgi:N-methylhydantoinase B/oxoprolinase/acetone carboxylase alpha subunit
MSATIYDASEMIDALESLVDKYGMVKIMVGLEHIADEKAEYVQSNWQDLGLADVWRKVSDALISKRLSNALNRLPIQG